jgi:hypothetical protein
MRSPTWLASFLLCLIFLSGCATEQPPARPSIPDPPEEDAAVTLARADRRTEKADLPQYSSQARRAAEAYMSQALPEWAVQGMCVEYISGNRYLISVDAIKESYRWTIELRVHLFTTPKGERYWKTDIGNLYGSELKPGEKFKPRIDCVILPYEQVNEVEAADEENLYNQLNKIGHSGAKR